MQIKRATPSAAERMLPDTDLNSCLLIKGQSLNELHPSTAHQVDLTRPSVTAQGDGEGNRAETHCKTQSFGIMIHTLKMPHLLQQCFDCQHERETQTIDT